MKKFLATCCCPPAAPKSEKDIPAFTTAYQKFLEGLSSFRAVSEPGIEDPDYRPVKGHKRNLQTILKAANAGDLGLVECQLVSTGERVAVLCAKTEDSQVVPFAILLNGNPYELLTPPFPDNDSDPENPEV
jgi:hypothetical protein